MLLNWKGEQDKRLKHEELFETADAHGWIRDARHPADSLIIYPLSARRYVASIAAFSILGISL